MRNFILIFVLTLAACVAPVETPEPGGKTYHVYFLSGQSNMEGYGSIDDLPEDLKQTQDAFPIYMGNIGYDHERGGGLGLWATLQPGFGKEFRSNGKTNRLSKFFGPEISFALEMKHLHPDQNIAIIKYAKSGAGIAPGASHGGNYLPDYRGVNGLNQYDFAVETIRGALSALDIDGDGKQDQLIPAGIAWMQGEADAQSAATAQAYYLNLHTVIHHFRYELKSPTLPVVIGKITDSLMNDGGPMMPHIDTVHAAQRRFVETDYCAIYMTQTDGYEHSTDQWHYTADAYVEMGRAFAQALSSRTQTCPG